MTIEVVVAVMGILVMGLTFLGGVVLISNADEGLAQDRASASVAAADEGVTKASDDHTAKSVKV